MLREIGLLLLGVNKLKTSNKRVISSVILLSIFSTQIFAEEPINYLQSGRKLIKDAVAYVAERQLESAVAGVLSFAAGAVAYVMLKNSAQPAAANIGAPVAALAGFAAHAANQVPHIVPHHPPAHHPALPPQNPQYPDVSQLNPEQMLALALERSAQEAAPFQALQMGPADYRFNLELFEVFRTRLTVEEQVTYLQELLYNHDQVFMEHDALLAFVFLVQGMSTADIVAAFHKLDAKRWSLLAVVPQEGAIDPEQVPTPNLRSMREDYRRIREILVANGNVDAAYQALLQRERHAVENAILRLVLRRLFVPQGLSPDDIQRADFALANLFGDHNPPAAPVGAPPLQVIPAAAQPLAPPQPAPRELTPEEIRELREARLKRLEKKA